MSNLTIDSNQVATQNTHPRLNTLAIIAGCVIALGIITYLVVFQMIPLIEETGTIEQVYALYPVESIGMSIAIVFILGSVFRLVRRKRRLKENPFFEDSYHSSRFKSNDF